MRSACRVVDYRKASHNLSVYVETSSGVIVSNGVYIICTASSGSVYSLPPEVNYEEARELLRRTTTGSTAKTTRSDGVDEAQLPGGQDDAGWHPSRRSTEAQAGHAVHESHEAHTLQSVYFEESGVGAERAVERLRGEAEGTDSNEVRQGSTSCRTAGRTEATLSTVYRLLVRQGFARSFTEFLEDPTGKKRASLEGSSRCFFSKAQVFQGNVHSECFWCHGFFVILYIIE